MSEQKLLKRKRKADLEGNRISLANASVDLAEFYYQKQFYERAITEYMLASGIYKDQTGMELDYARTNRRIGEAFVYLKEYRKALDHQEIYLSVARQQGDKLEEQRALATIGHIHLTHYSDDDTDKGLLNLAYKAFIKSLVICEKLENVVNKYEHKDMMARLLGNLGVVLESLGDYDKGINLLLRSITLCKTHDLYEQLQRSHTCLASLYSSKGDYNNAIQQYNAAIEVAGRLKNKVSLKYECLKSKADILIKLADFQGAKMLLLKAYKLIQSSGGNEDIKQKLKVVASVCYSEDSLLTTSNSDYKLKKSLYEKLGDGACFLNNFPHAIEYYTKMLEAAVTNGESGSDLSPCYISLAETYRDNKQFELAIEYFRKDYESTNSNSKDRIKTLLNIADCMEASGKDIIDIEGVYDQARNQSISIGDKIMQHRVISRHITMLCEKGRMSQSAQLEMDLKDIDVDSSQYESEPPEEDITTNIGDDISIKDITDVSSDSDVENNDINKPRASRRRTKGFVIKKNPKGETQLHTACINGNAELVKRLLEQGHVVNIRDNCGWLPIHEACICGHLDIVEMLIQKGAWINDRGGKLCDGITPLHDAASNGHLNIIQLLLDKGASAVAKTNSGVMPLYMLQKWHEINQLDTESANLYGVITKRLMQDMEKLGQSRNCTVENKDCSALVTEGALIPSAQPVKKNKAVVEKSKPVLGKLRRNVSCDIDLDQKRSITNEPEVSSDALYSNRFDNNIEEQEHAKDEYCKVIENLRYSIREGNVDKKRKSSDGFRSALLQPGEVGDDWLENDLPVKHKKHKSNTMIKRHSSGSLRRHNSTGSSNSNKTECDNLDELFDSDFSINDIDNVVVYEQDLAHSQKTAFSKRKSQTSLIDQGFTRHRSFSPTNTLTSNINRSMHKRKHQTKITSFGEHTPSSEFKSNVEQSFTTNNHRVISNVFNPEPTLSIDVRIDGKLYRVPVLASELHFRTIRWLADEASDRYSRKECVKPTLELETKNGALLAEEDFLNILFNAATSQAEEVEARIVKWNLPSLSERYVEASISLGTATNSTVLKILQDTSTSLNFAGMGLGHINVMPLCKSINRQINLHYLNLSDNYMRNGSLQLLCLSLPSLDNLTVLNLSNNELTSEGLKYLAEIFVQSPKPVLINLISLDLSYNSLGDDSLKSLAILTRYLKLEILDLVDVGFTNQIFDSIANRNVDLCLDHIVNFNISYNKLNKQQITTILSWINPQNCEELNISSNNVSEQGLLKDVIYWLKDKGTETLKLKSLSVSRCKITDMEVDELLRCMPCLVNLKYLDLSYNEYLSSYSLNNLLKYPLAVHIVGCQNVLQNFENTSTENSSIKINELRLSVNCTDVHKNRLVGALQNAYQEKVILLELKDYFQSSILH